MLQKNTVERKTFELLTYLMNEHELSSTRLVGGTALALQIGHRKSTDLDLFTEKPVNIEKIASLLNEKYNYSPQIITDDTTIGFINGIKIDIVNHRYKWLSDTKKEGNIRMASLTDIAAMKLHAITNSGKRPKDFVDIAFLSQMFSYDTIKNFALTKYPIYDPIMFDRAIIYFDDIEKSNIEKIKMIGYQLKWKEIENRIIKMTDNPQKTFLNPPLRKITPKNTLCL